MTATRLLDPPGAGASASPDNAIPMNVENDLGATHVGGDRLDRVLDDLPNPDCGCEVNHLVALANRLVHHGVVEDGIHVEMQIGVLPNGREVL